MKNRIAWIDIAKAIGIGFVVLGHTGVPVQLRSWIYSFHMPLFFVIAGLWFKDYPISHKIKKAAKGYLIPYIGYSLLFLIIDLVMKVEGPPIENTLKNILTGKGSFMILWFLWAVFMIEVLYQILYKCLKKQILISAVLLLCAILAWKSNTYGINNMFLWKSVVEGALFYSIGAVIKKYNLLEYDMSLSKGSIAIIISTLISSIGFIYTGRYLDIAEGQLYGGGNCCSTRSVFCFLYI